MVGSEPLPPVDPVEPVEPLEADWRGAEHDAVVPPLAPAQLQFQGPLPVTADAVPALQRFVVGAVLVAAPFALPHTPFTGCAASCAEQVAVVPPLLPAHVHVQGPLPVTADAVPELQRLAVGALVKLPPLDDPQTPLTGVGSVEEASVA